MDDTDKKILSELEKDSRASYTDLAKKLDLSDVAIKKRIDRLFKNGVIKSFSIALDQAKLGRGLHAFLLVKATPAETNKASAELAKIDGVMRVMPVVGAFDLLVEVACKDVEQLHSLTEERVGSLRGILEVRPLIIV